MELSAFSIPFVKKREEMEDVVERKKIVEEKTFEVREGTLNVGPMTGKRRELVDTVS